VDDYVDLVIAGGSASVSGTLNVNVNVTSTATLAHGGCVFTRSFPLLHREPRYKRAARAN
jgi:hypothetical protein